MSRFALMLSLVVILTLWFSRSVYVLPTDWSHLQDRFDHSQWRIPNSNRVISDNELYQVAGRALVNGADPFSINPEVPPLAKYTYGLSDLLTTNPYWASLVYFGLTLVVFYLLAKEMYHRNQPTQIAVLLLAITPLFFYQLTQTMLDLPQVFFLLLHLLAMLKLQKQKGALTFTSNLGWLLLAGFSLGACAACKVPLLIPLVVLADSWLLWRAKLPHLLPLILALGLLTYIASYSRYFLLEHNLIDWLKAQKWMFAFYQMSETPTSPLTFWSTSLVGWYQGWWNEAGSWVGEWSLLWPLVVIVPLFTFLRRRLTFSKAEPQQQYVLILFGGLIAMYTLIPFWARYFLTLLPIGILLFTPTLLTWPKWMRVGLFIILIIQAGLFLRPQPSDTLKFARLDLEKGNYQDLVNYLNPSELTDNNMSRADVAQAFQKLTHTAGGAPTSIELTAPYVWPWQNHIPVQAKLVFPTTTLNPELKLSRIHNRWFISGATNLLN